MRARRPYARPVAAASPSPAHGSRLPSIDLVALVDLPGDEAVMRGRQTPPLLTRAQIKFMTLNLDFSIAKAKRLLGYRPRVDFRDGIVAALDFTTGKSKAQRETAAAV